MVRVTAVDRSGGLHDIELSQGQVVMEGLRELSAGVDAICGGLCSCATCHVYIAHAWSRLVGPPSPHEADLLMHLDAFNEKHSRLSCQIVMSTELDGLELTIAPDE